MVAIPFQPASLFPPSYNPSPAAGGPHHHVAQMLPPHSGPLDQSANSCPAWQGPRDPLPRPFPIFCSQHFQESLSPPSLPENTWHCPTLGLGQTVPSGWNALPLGLTKPHCPSQPSAHLTSSEKPPDMKTHRCTLNTGCTCHRLPRPGSRGSLTTPSHERSTSVPPSNSEASAQHRRGIRGSLPRRLS